MSFEGRPSSFLIINLHNLINEERLYLPNIITFSACNDCFRCKRILKGLDMSLLQRVSGSALLLYAVSY